MKKVGICEGISHITGGGFYENIPPVFRLLGTVGRISEREMLNTFNMGTGMCVIVDKADADRAALERGVKITGATVHYVNEIPDGGEIIMQKTVNVHPGDTPEMLQRRVMKNAEWKILPLAVEQECRRLREEAGQNPGT